MTKPELLFLLKKYNIHPRREQGQCFLIDDDVTASTLAAANLQPTDTVLEIGPGFGILTTQLLEAAGSVIAVEYDRTVFRALQPLATQYSQLQLHQADIRTWHAAAVGLHDRAYKLVANLPYNITSWVLRHFLHHAPRPQQLVVMVQKEVAQRITAVPGSMSVLAHSVQVVADTSIVRYVPRSSFYPQPAVDSAIISITLKPTPLSHNVEQYLQLVKLGFAGKRKQLHNTMAAGLQISAAQAKTLLQTAECDPHSRPQELTIATWEKIRRTVFDELKIK